MEWVQNNWHILTLFGYAWYLGGKLEKQSALIDALYERIGILEHRVKNVPDPDDYD